MLTRRAIGVLAVLALLTTLAVGAAALGVAQSGAPLHEEEPEPKEPEPDEPSIFDEEIFDEKEPLPPDAVVLMESRDSPLMTSDGVTVDAEGTLIGTNGDDLIHGDNVGETIRGLDGRDTLDGGDGSDEIHGGRRDDQIGDLAGYDTDVIWAGDGDDEIGVAEGSDAGDVPVVEMPGRPYIPPGSVNDADEVHCADGHDTVVADPDDWIDEDCEEVTILS